MTMNVYKITCYANDEYLVVAKNFGEAETKFKQRFGLKDIITIEELKLPLV